MQKKKKWTSDPSRLARCCLTDNRIHWCVVMKMPHYALLWNNILLLILSYSSLFFCYVWSALCSFGMFSYIRFDSVFPFFFNFISFFFEAMSGNMYIQPFTRFHFKRNCQLFLQHKNMFFSIHFFPKFNSSVSSPSSFAMEKYTLLNCNKINA